jgi:hypothetical protein
MTPKPKQIVIDKDAFIGIDLDTLCEFAKHHFVLVSETLLYECATSPALRRRRLLSRCRDLIQAGAYYCTRGIEFVEYELRQLEPHPPLLPNLTRTQRIRAGLMKEEQAFTVEQIEQISGIGANTATRLFLETVASVRSQIPREHPDMVARLKALPQDRIRRLSAFVASVDTASMHELAVRSMPRESLGDATKFCLSPGWITWQFFRLACVVANEYYYLDLTGGVPGDTRAEHDYQDVEHVLLLSRADAIVTRDKKLVEPLARAAFPEKEVFSSLKEVPASYRWDGTST